jgi:AraC family transcriptional regulator
MRSSPRPHINEIVFEGDLIKIGRWRLPSDHPNFRDSGPTRHYLVVFPRTGTWIQHAGAAMFPSDANNVTFYNQHQEYIRRAISPVGDHCDYYAIDPHLLRQIVSEWDPAAADEERRIMRFSHGPSDARSYLTQRSVYEHVRREPNPDPLFVEESMCRVLERVFRMAYAAVRRGGERHRELIARRFNARMTLSELAAAVGASPFHLCRAFRAETGLTIHACRNQLRLRASLDRVLDPAADLTEVALDLGFCSHSHFTAAFRRLYGLTPSAARKRVDHYL